MSWFMCLYIMRQITHICGWVCLHKIFVILLRESGLIFLQNYFYNNSICIIRVCKCMVDVRSASRGAWQDTPILYLENYYKKKDAYFSMIHLVSSRLWSKIFRKILSRMPDHPKRRAHFYLENYYKKTDAYFSMIHFASSRLWSKFFFKHGQLPKGVWQDHAYISLKSYCRETVEYFCIVPFESSRQWCKSIWKI